MNSLPLSWSINNGRSFHKLEKTVKIKNLTWLAYQQTNFFKITNQLKKNDLSNKKEKFLIRGCNTTQMNNLKQFGYSSFQFGMEAIIKTNQNPFEKTSLMSLVKRGMRHGKIQTLPFTEENKKRLDDFKKESRHGDYVQLENLFQTDFSEQNKLFVFIDKFENWLGAILVSNNSSSKLHTELILKRKESPVGIMETLIYKIFHEAKDQEIEELSLGEVPFIFSSKKNLLSKISFLAGKNLKFAYNYKGLYNFKNKFQPIWQPLFICSNSKNKFLDLFLIFHYSNFSKLILQKLLYSVKP